MTTHTEPAGVPDAQGPEAARPMDARHEEEAVNDVLQRLLHTRIETLPPHVLLQIDEELAERQQAVKREALALEGRLREDLMLGHGTVLSSLRKSTRRLERRLREITNERERVENAYQERVLQERMIARLGSARRVQALEGLVLVLIFFVLGLLIYETVTPGLSREARRTIFLIDTACCAVFMTEFFLRHQSADSKHWYWRHHWIDFITSIPMPDAALLRAGRLARVARVARIGRVARAARLLRLLRAMRIILFFWRGLDKLAEVLDVRLMKKTLAIGLTILLVGAIAIRYAENAYNEVNTFGSATWWSFTTFVTGGFGDIHNPQSMTGRFVTVVLVIAGMVVVGVFTATLTAILVQDESDEIESLQRGFELKIDALTEKINALAEGRDERGMDV